MCIAEYRPSAIQNQSIACHTVLFVQWEDNSLFLGDEHTVFSSGYLNR
jgi:hypothetical protein